MLFFTGNIVTSAMMPTAVLLLDLNRDNAASALAALNLVRMLLSAGFIAAYTPLINTIGIGWTSTMTAGIYVVFAPCLWLVYRYGYRWRVERDQKQERDGEAGQQEEQV